MKPYNELSICLLDTVNAPTNGGYYLKPQVKNIEEAFDINEVESIDLYFNTIEEANEVVKKFPKYTKAEAYEKSGSWLKEKAPALSQIDWQTDDYIYGRRPVVSVKFNTFFLNETTGKINESAVKARNKFVEILKSL